MLTTTQTKIDLKEEKKVLLVASSIETGERYAYYTIQALLIFFFIDHMNYEESAAETIVGTAIAMTYISAILGGFIAEKLLGYYRTALVGAFLMVAGSLVLATTDSYYGFCLALSLISTSSGLIKSNMASFLGRFYDKTPSLIDGNRDFGFSIFYMGINLGGLFSLFLAGFLKDHYGFHVAFLSITIFSTIMLAFFILAYSSLRKHIIKLKITKAIIFKTIVAILIYVTVSFFVFLSPMIANYSTFLTILGSIYILLISSRATDKKIIILVACMFFALSIIYWSLYFQIFLSILLFINNYVDTSVLSSVQQLGIVNLGIIIFGFFIGKLWLFFAQKGKPIDDINKFNIGFILIIICFSVMLFTIYISSQGVKVSYIGFVVAFFILALSDLSLSAIGLSLTTKIAPKNYVSLYIGVWLITMGIGGKLGGYLAHVVSFSNNSLMQAKTNMSHGLLIFILIGLMTSFIIFISRNWIKKNIF